MLKLPLVVSLQPFAALTIKLAEAVPGTVKLVEVFGRLEVLPLLKLQELRVILPLVIVVVLVNSAGAFEQVGPVLKPAVGTKIEKSSVVNLLGHCTPFIMLIVFVKSFFEIGRQVEARLKRIVVI